MNSSQGHFSVLATGLAMMLGLLPTAQLEASEPMTGANIRAWITFEPVDHAVTVVSHAIASTRTEAHYQLMIESTSSRGIIRSRDARTVYLDQGARALSRLAIGLDENPQITARLTLTPISGEPLEVHALFPLKGAWVSKTTP